MRNSTVRTKSASRSRSPDLAWMLACALLLGMAWAVTDTAGSAELSPAGSSLRVTGTLDGSAAERFQELLAGGRVTTVVFEDSQGGTAEAALIYAQAIRAAGVRTEVRGQCSAACAYAFLAGREHRFSTEEQVHALLIPVGTRPAAHELGTRWRGEEAHRTLAEFAPLPAADGPAPQDGVAPIETRVTPQWRPEHAVLFVATPTLFGRVYTSYYCDGSQGRDLTRCEALADADPRKLGIIDE